MDGERTLQFHGGPRMTVTKAVVLGILLASLAISKAQASSVLTLGVNSNSGSTPSSTGSSSPFSFANFQSSGTSGLTLGVVSNSGTSSYVAPNESTSASYSSPSDSTTSQSLNLGSTNSVVAPASFSPSASSSGTTTYDAMINFGNGPYPNANSLTNGNAQAWYMSPAVDKLFGGAPTAAQQSAFDSTVLQRVQQTFNLSGVPVTLTDNSNDSAAHTLSVVSGTTNPSMSNAIGMTYLGGNGFHYINNSANAAQTVDQLEWIVAHNISHELMLAFNVPENYDQSGNYIDARNASFSMMTNPNATFSQGAVNALLAQNFLNTNSSAGSIAAQLLEPSTVPEPSTVLLWVSIGSVGLVIHRGRKRAAASHA
jgi:hypothetical protein